MKKFIISILLALGFMLPVGLSAQSNEVMDVFLSRNEADLGTSVYLVLAAMNVIDQSSSVEDAVSLLEESGNYGKIRNLDTDRSISYGEFSYIVMETLGEKGGLMYRILPGPRYAAREVSYKKWIIGKSIPGRILKPFEVINALVTIMEEEGTK